MGGGGGEVSCSHRIGDVFSVKNSPSHSVSIISSQTIFLKQVEGTCLALLLLCRGRFVYSFRFGWKSPSAREDDDEEGATVKGEREREREKGIQSSGQVADNSRMEDHSPADNRPVSHQIRIYCTSVLGDASAEPRDC